ncbi:hypothetical protein TGARI_281030, partial [Toxoplasma gondii ARI]
IPGVSDSLANHPWFAVNPDTLRHHIRNVSWVGLQNALSILRLPTVSYTHSAPRLRLASPTEPAPFSLPAVLSPRKSSSSNEAVCTQNTTHETTVSAPRMADQRPLIVPLIAPCDVHLSPHWTP